MQCSAHCTDTAVKQVPLAFVLMSRRHCVYYRAVLQVSSNRKPVRDLLLVINSNSHPISYRFRVIAAYCSIFRHVCVFEPHFGGLRDNVRRSSWVHRKARSGLPISVKWTFFARCYGYERIVYADSNMQLTCHSSYSTAFEAPVNSSQHGVSAAGQLSYDFGLSRVDRVTS